LDGGGTAIHAFLGGGDNVMIQNLVIQNYNAPIQDAPVSNCASQSSNWIIANNEIAVMATQVCWSAEAAPT